MGNRFVAVIFILIALSLDVFAVSKAGNGSFSGQLNWKTIKNDVQHLSRNAFYNKYSNSLKDSGIEVQKLGHLLSPKEVERDLHKVSRAFFLKGYAQSEEIDGVEKEFKSLEESSSGAYAVLKKRVYDLNLKYYKDKSIPSNLRRTVNNELSDLFRKLEKHHLAINSIPSMGKMVSVLGQKINSSNLQGKIGSKSNSLMTFSLQQVGYLLLVFVGITMVMVGKTKHSQKIARKKLELERSNIVPGVGLNRTGVIGIDARGRVASINCRAVDLFQGYIKKGDDWDNFFQQKFYNGKKYLRTKGFHRFVNTPEKVYFFNSKIDEASKNKIIEISRMNLKDFEQALNLMERSSIQVDSMEIIDNVFTELINLNSISLSLDIFNKFHFGIDSDYLYLSSLEGKKYLARVLKIIDCVNRVKTSGDISRIDVNRQGSDFNITAIFAQCSISEMDLRKIVRFGGKKIDLGEVFNSFQENLNGYETSLIVKNLTLNGERKVELKFKIQDNSHFDTIHREKTFDEDIYA